MTDSRIIPTIWIEGYQRVYPPDPEPLRSLEWRRAAETEIRLAWALVGDKLVGPPIGCTAAWLIGQRALARAIEEGT